MTYEELKSKDIYSISNLEEVKEYVNEVLESEEQDIIKYINYLRWYQYNGASINEMKFISKLLNMDGLYELEYNCDIELGEVEDLVVDEIVEEEKYQSTKITVDGLEYNVYGVFEDSFEKIFVINEEGKLKTFGSIDNLIYELPEEPEEFLWQVVDLQVGARVNFNSHYDKIGYVKKTFRKVENDVEGTYVFTKKSPQGVMAPVNGGTYNVVKVEEIYTSDLEKTLEDEVNKRFTEYVEKYEKKYLDVIEKYKEELSKYEGKQTPENFVEKLNSEITKRLENKQLNEENCDGSCEECGCEKEETLQLNRFDDFSNDEDEDEEEYDEDKVYNANELEFAIMYSSDFELPTVVIQPNGFFAKHNYICDYMGGHNINPIDLINGGTEDTEMEESIFEPLLTEQQREDYIDEKPVQIYVDEWREKMISAGFHYNKDLEDFINKF